MKQLKTESSMRAEDLNLNLNLNSDAPEKFPTD
jgi:hypothetical protein